MSTPAKRPRDRTAQKLRTRAALLSAARALVAEGQSPSVAEVADLANVSRATAYRYFPTQEALLVEVPLDEDAPTVADLFGEGAPSDPEERAVLVHGALYDLARDHEQEFRLFLRSSLTRGMKDGETSADPFRGARRVALLREALAPLAGELSPKEIQRLATALSMLVGVEAMIVLRDVLRLGHEEAREAGEWAVRQLVRAVRGTR
jgi:AcrR family transcriptional regulator